MKLNRLESFLFFILSVGVFWLAFPTMLEVFSVPNPNYVIVPIFLLSLIAYLFKPYILKIPLYISVVIASLYFSNYLVNKTPFFSFIIREYRVLKELITGISGEYSATTSYLILLLFLLILVEIQFYWENVLLVGLVCIGYLMLLNVFNDILIVKNVVLIACLVLLLNFLLSNGLREPKLFFTVTLVVCLIGLGSLFIPTTKLQTKMLSTMMPYRNYITEKGLYRFISERGSGELKRTGFGEDDSRLGGSISDDLTVQFNAKQKDAHYWKIDSKSVYTGKGWEKATLENQEAENFDYEIDFERNFVNKEDKTNVTLSLMYTNNYVPTTYGQLTIRDVNNQLTFNKNELTDRVTMDKSNQNNEILVEVEPLAYKEDDLKNTNNNLPKNEIDYLQLPDDFPEEIRELAVSITQDKNSKIEKVLAIQDYLKTNEKYRYSKNDTTYPTDNQDYVEHFLFESLIGYCDNFSTAMAVMLRSIDIPTRWAKGFNTGSVTGKEDGLDIYTIRNSNAHSWVEVYFADYGWLPFEPTPSFATPRVQQTNTTENSSTAQSNSTTSSNSSTANTQNKSDNSSTQSSSNVKAKDNSSVSFEKVKPYLISLLLIALLFMASMLYKYWLFIWLKLALTRETFSFTYFYPLLLKKAERTLERESNEPLLKYALRLEAKFPQFGTDFSYLTKIYEEHIYGSLDSFSKSDRQIVKRLNGHLHKK